MRSLRLLLLVLTLLLLSGCAWFRAQSQAGHEMSTQTVGRGTTGVSDGADPGSPLTGSDVWQR